MTYVPETWVDYTIPCLDAAHLNAIEHGIDIAQGDIMVLRGLTANIPATDAELVGRLYIETDLLLRTWRDNGAGWDLAITPGGGGGVWVFIAETILGAPAASITFAAIPATYRHLFWMCELRTDRVAEWDYFLMRFNADAGNNYDGRWTQFVNATTYGGGVAQTSIAAYVSTEAANSRASCYGMATVWMAGYASAVREKFAMIRAIVAGNRGAWTDFQDTLSAGTWRNTAAINRVDFLPFTGPNFVAGSTIALYGIT